MKPGRGDNDTSQFPAAVLRAWKTIGEHEARSTIGKTAVDDSGAGSIQQSAKGTFYLPATQEALDVRIDSGWGQHFSMLLSNNSDQTFAVIAVSVEYEGSALGTINRPEKGMAWTVEARGRTVISWQSNTNLVNDLIKIKGEYRQQYSVRVDLVFQCEVNRQSTQFRKRVLVQVDPVNRYLLQI